MKYKVFSIFDTKAATFSQPFYSANLITATRWARILVNDGESVVSHSPYDFQVMVIGEFDDESGALVAPNQPTFVCNCSSLKEGNSDAP